MQHESVRMERFIYRTPHKRSGYCRIEAQSLGDGRVVVIATELKDNPGMSITNAAEYVATEVCRHLRIDPTRLIWIEHYGYPVPGESKRVRTYDRVTFTTITPDHELIFHEPSWHVMKPEDWLALGLEPRENQP